MQTITIATTEAGKRACEEWADHLPAGCEFVVITDTGALPDGVEHVDVFFVFYDLFFQAHENLQILPQLCAIAQHCDWVQAGSAGWDDQVLGSLKQQSKIYCNASGVHAPAIAQYVLGHLLTYCKRFDEHRQFQQAHEWRITPGDGELTGASLGIVGYGGIGKAVAELARVCGMYIRAIRRNPQPDVDADEVWGTERLDELIAASQYLVLCAPHSEDTQGLMDRRRFDLMPDGAVLVNVGRGSAIVEADLIEALNSNKLAYAALDTTVEEPLSADSPLWDTPRLYISPHDSAHSSGSVPRLLELFCDNLTRYAKGEALRNQVIE